MYCRCLADPPYCYPVQAWRSVATFVNSLPEGQLQNVLRYHASTVGARLVSWNPTGPIATYLGIQTLELTETRWVSTLWRGFVLCRLVHCLVLSLFWLRHMGCWCCFVRDKSDPSVPAQVYTAACDSIVSNWRPLEC
jgi:hypothetical protein